jgi:hypothetical protein
MRAASPWTTTERAEHILASDGALDRARVARVADDDARPGRGGTAAAPRANAVSS